MTPIIRDNGIGIVTIPHVKPAKNTIGILTTLNREFTEEVFNITTQKIPIAKLIRTVMGVESPPVDPNMISPLIFKNDASSANINTASFNIFAIQDITAMAINTLNQFSIKYFNNSKNTL